LDPRGSAIIDFTEAAYDLQAADGGWLSALMRAGTPVLDHGLGIFALACIRPPEPGSLLIDDAYLSSSRPELARGLMRLQDELDLEILWSVSRPGMPKTLSEVCAEHDPGAFEQIMRYFDFARDGLGLSAFECSGRGVFLIAPLAEVTSLTPRSRERWQMLAAHFGAGYRLRRALPPGGETPVEGLPCGAEAVIEPRCFRVMDAQGPATSRGALDALRGAALKVDRARGRMRRTDPQQALEIWQALVRGRWSTVDWFDSDGRRFVLAMPNAPDMGDPRGLTEREHQAVAYAACGQTNKMIGYHLGLSKSRVSVLLSSAMRKLRVSNRAQLVSRFRHFAVAAQPPSDTTKDARPAPEEP
jgi:DNA-binding CsgD family transcriptional regulator